MPFQIIRQDITKMEVDVIVNSADPKPRIGSGVDYAIHKAGGEELVKARIALGPIRTTEVKYTEAYLLNAKYVFHTVGPVWNQENQETLTEELYTCYKESLILAEYLSCESIAFPLISAGAFGFPIDLAIDIATKAIKEFLEKFDIMVYLVVYDKKSFIISKSKYIHIQSYIEENFIRDSYGIIGAELQRRGMRYDRHSSVESFDVNADTWQESLLKHIIESGQTNAEIYKKANITKQTFSEILKFKEYHPSKATAIAFCIALELDLDEMNELIKKAGYQLSLSIKSDIIVKYYVERKIYDIFEINETLFEFDQDLLGSTILD